MRGVAQSEFDRTCLQEGRSLRCQHARYHRLEELGQNGKHGLACATQEVDDQVANDEPAGLVFALQLLRDHCQDAIETCLARCRVRPRNELIDILADKQGEARNAVLCSGMRLATNNHDNRPHLNDIPIFRRTETREETWCEHGKEALPQASLGSAAYEAAHELNGCTRDPRVDCGG